MKILLVLTDLVTGGAEIFTLRLASSLQSSGHDVTLVILRGEVTEYQLIQTYWPDGKVIHYRHPILPLILKIDGLLYRLRLDQSLLNLFQVRFLKRLIVKLKPNLLHSHLFSSDWTVAQALADTRIPWISTIHGDYLDHAQGCVKARTHLRHFLHRCNYIDRCINQVVVISDAQRETMAQLLPESHGSGLHRLIMNGLPLPAFGPIAPYLCQQQRRQVGLCGDGLVVGMVARGIAEKGWDVLIRAFEQADLPEAELLLIGEGPALRYLANHYVSPRIHFHGPCSDPLGLIRLCDFTCLPSRYTSESCPLVVAESLSVGVPVIATRVGQISWMLDEHTPHPAGLTLPLQDPDPLSAALAAQLQALHRRPQRLTAWKQNCLKARQKFAIERCAEAYLQAYQAAGA